MAANLEQVMSKMDADVLFNDWLTGLLTEYMRLEQTLES